MLASHEIRPVRDGIRGQPACPNCGRSMHLTRITPGASDRRNVRTFGCGECGVWATEAADDGQTE
jgi:hypothetical protein